jgi:hypothetical protein
VILSIPITRASSIGAVPSTTNWFTTSNFELFPYP